jgi:hypothetical protein
MKEIGVFTLIAGVALVVIVMLLGTASAQTAKDRKRIANLKPGPIPKLKSGHIYKAASRLSFA